MNQQWLWLALCAGLLALAHSTKVETKSSPSLDGSGDKDEDSFLDVEENGDEDEDIFPDDDGDDDDDNDEISGSRDDGDDADTSHQVVELAANTSSSDIYFDSMKVSSTPTSTTVSSRPTTTTADQSAEDENDHSGHSSETKQAPESSNKLSELPRSLILGLIVGGIVLVVLLMVVIGLIFVVYRLHSGRLRGSYLLPETKRPIYRRGYTRARNAEFTGSNDEFYV